MKKEGGTQASDQLSPVLLGLIPHRASCLRPPQHAECRLLKEDGPRRKWELDYK